MMASGKGGIGADRGAQSVGHRRPPAVIAQPPPVMSKLWPMADRLPGQVAKRSDLQRDVIEAVFGVTAARDEAIDLDRALFRREVAARGCPD